MIFVFEKKDYRNRIQLRGHHPIVGYPIQMNVNGMVYNVPRNRYYHPTTLMKQQLNLMVAPIIQLLVSIYRIKIYNPRYHWNLSIYPIHSKR